MIEISKVTKKFGTFTAIEDLSITVEEASIYGLVGYNGAGKTTLLKTVSGVYRPDGGVVRLFGEDVFDNAKMKQRLFYIPDDLYFQPYTTMQKMARFYRGYYPHFSYDTFNSLTEVFGLDKTKRINGFSKGMQRQAEIILGLATHPDVLLLDESFDGLDPQKREIVRRILLEYVAESGASVIISSHDLHDLGNMCDRIGLINAKHLALDAKIDEISENRCKFRLAFQEEKQKEDFAGIDYSGFKQDGKIIEITVRAKVDEAEAKLKAMAPAMIERMPLTLEEIFLDEMEGMDYDFSKIFSAQ